MTTKKCQHKSLQKIDHWWYRLKCNECGKKLRKLPLGTYVQLIDRNENV